MVKLDNWIEGNGEHLRMLTSNVVLRPQVLVIAVHGDVSAGGPGDYLFDLLSKCNIGGTMIVGLIRPGYPDRSGERSTGHHFDRRDSYTAHNIDAVFDAIRKLRNDYKPRQLVVVGHSGGAAITAIGIGKYPGLVDTAILLSCPCNVSMWRQDRDPWPRSLSPHSYIHGICPTTDVIALVGESDINTPPALSLDFINELKKLGNEAQCYVIQGATHSAKDLTSSKAFGRVLCKILSAQPNKRMQSDQPAAGR